MNKCPDCGMLMRSNSKGEIICPECGLVEDDLNCHFDSSPPRNDTDKRWSLPISSPKYHKQKRVDKKMNRKGIKINSIIEPLQLPERIKETLIIEFDDIFRQLYSQKETRVWTRGRNQNLEDSPNLYVVIIKFLLGKYMNEFLTELLNIKNHDEQIRKEEEFNKLCHSVKKFEETYSKDYEKFDLSFKRLYKKIDNGQPLVKHDPDIEKFNRNILIGLFSSVVDKPNKCSNDIMIELVEQTLIRAYKKYINFRETMKPKNVNGLIFACGYNEAKLLYLECKESGISMPKPNKERWIEASSVDRKTLDKRLAEIDVAYH
jgi:uncharacterized Zn finger protein (UPF0148 family)